MVKRIMKNLVLITIPVSFLLFVLLEVIVRISFDYIDYYDNPMNFWSEPSSYFNINGKPGNYNGKTINQHGFISTPEINISKPDSTIRIVFLGGSSTAGMGINLLDEETWPWKSIDNIKKQNENVKIDFINGALGSYTTFDSYGRLWSQLRFFDPDVIIVNHGWNEMYYFNEIADNPISWHKKINKNHFNDFWITIKSKLLSWSQVIVRTKLIFENRKSKFGEVGANHGLLAKYNPKGLEVLQGNIRLFLSFAKEFNCTIFFCKQPSLISKNTKTEDKARCRYEYHGFNHEQHVKAFNEIYSLIDNIVVKPYIIDLTSVSAISENFFDHVHPTKTGSDKIAKIVSDSLINNYFSKIY